LLIGSTLHRAVEEHRLLLLKDSGKSIPMNSGEGLTEAQIWMRIIRPEAGDFSADGARELLRLAIPDGDKQRAYELGVRANRGELSESEEAELDHYLNVSRTLELIKAKARLSLKIAA
jgi:hypothetical protein